MPYESALPIYAFINCWKQDVDAENGRFSMDFPLEVAGLVFSWCFQEVSERGAAEDGG